MGVHALGSERFLSCIWMSDCETLNPSGNGTAKGLDSKLTVIMQEVCEDPLPFET